MTPLVDVMLVLLIIFMVAAPMMTTALPVDLPSARAERAEIEQETPLITVSEDQRVFLGEEETGLGGLERALRNHPGVQAEKKVYVQGDTAVPYGFVVQVFAVIRAAGVNDLGLVTDPAGGANMPPSSAEE
ncbi:MAG: biopolymer transporter ExbD [Polyangiaceae bacterium]|nr:biopolymer transporter ExbD [Polyangiaceae bacterium]